MKIFEIELEGLTVCSFFGLIPMFTLCVVCVCVYSNLVQSQWGFEFDNEDV